MEVVDGFARVGVSDCRSYHGIGKPVLPFRTAKILLPRGSKVEAVSLDFPDPLQMLNVLAPVDFGRTPISMAAGRPGSTRAADDRPDPAIYASEEPFPAERAQMMSVQEMCGYRIGVIRIFPVQYLPARGRLMFAPRVRVSVTLSSAPVDLKAATRVSTRRSDVTRVTEFVDNPEGLTGYASAIDASRPPASTYDCLLVTRAAFTNAFRPLVSYRSTQGLDVKVVTVESILSGYPGVDDAEKVRNCIKEAYANWEIQCVLLGGDISTVPHRGAYGYASWEDTEIPADLYFACLDGSWNSDGDALWGEPNDGEAGCDVDLLAEVYVGRVPVDSEAEASTFVSKILDYEQNGVVNAWTACFVAEYLGKSFGYNLHGGNCLDYCTNHLAEYTCSWLDDRPTNAATWGSAESLAALNRSPHIVPHAGHATETNLMRLTLSDLDSLTNDAPFLLNSMACDCGAFDYSDCIAEELLKRNRHGAFALVVNSRFGWYSVLDEGQFSGEFQERFFHELLVQGHRRIADANQRSRHDMIGMVETSGNMTYRWCYFVVNMLGDPCTTLALGGGISVAPGGGWACSGYEGGPFSPSNSVYRLRNVSTSNLAWSATCTEQWAFAAPSNGMLAAGAFTNVSVRLNHLAGLLDPASYTNTVVFSNLTGRAGPSRDVELTVARRVLDGFVWNTMAATQYVGTAFPVEIRAVDPTGDAFPAFTGSVAVTGWRSEIEVNRIQNAGFESSEGWAYYESSPDFWYYLPRESPSWHTEGDACLLCYNSYAGDFLAGDYLSFSQDVDLTDIAQIRFDAKLDGGSDAPEGCFGISVHVDGTEEWLETGYTQYLDQAIDVSALLGVKTIEIRQQALKALIGGSDRGVRSWWDNFRTYAQCWSPVIVAPTTTSDFVAGRWSGNVTVSEEARSTFLRADEGNGCAGESNPFDVGLPPLVLGVPGSVAESAGVVTGSVTLVGATVSNLVVSLFSDDTTEVTVTNTVTVPAGETNGTFELRLLNDDELDGTQDATIIAAATGYRSGRAVIRVHDNETAALGVVLPEQAAEGDGVVTGQVSVSSVVDTNVTIALLSDDSSEVVVPSGVTVLEGRQSALFEVTIVDDGEIDGEQSATVTAHVENWSDGSDTMTVQDNDPRCLIVSVPVRSAEGEGVLVMAGAIGIPGTLTNDLEVSLRSDAPSVVTVTSLVTVAAGTTSVTFDVYVGDDAVCDGVQTASVSATALDFAPASDEIAVHDNDVHHFRFDTIDSPQTAAVHFSVTLAACDINGVPMPAFTGTVSLAANGAGGMLALSPTSVSAFVDGQWPGDVAVHAVDAGVRLEASDGAGHAGTSSVFDVMSGPLDHFVWGAVASTQYVDFPFPATLEACDANGYVVSDFTGTVGLTAWEGGTPDDDTSMTGVITNAGFETAGDWSYYESDPDFWYYLPRTSPQWHTEGSASLYCYNSWRGYYVAGDYLALSQDVDLTGVAQIRFDVKLDGGSAAPEGCFGISVRVDGTEEWGETGYAEYLDQVIEVSALSGVRTVEIRQEALKRHTSGSGKTVWSWWDNFRAYGPGPPPVVIAPTTTTSFAAGAWSGNVTLLGEATNVFLYADDGEGHTGHSEAIGTVVTIGDRDSDGDGLTDWEELVAGTSPTNAGDCFRINECAVMPGTRAFVLRWDTVTGRTYSVYWTTNLPPSWTTDGILFPGDGSRMTYTNLHGDTLKQCFRLRVQRENGAVVPPGSGH